MNDEFENALAWFASAPSRWAQSAKQDLSACAEWIWEVLQGDFHDNATTGQVVTGTVISMIPFVDQICDVRDVVANAKKINGEPSNKWHWVGLALTLIGLFPVLGSLLKGCGKVMFAGLRRAAATGTTGRVVVTMTDGAISQLNKFIARPEVMKTLKALQIDNVYKLLAKQLRGISASLTRSKLMKGFDEAIEAAKSLLDLVKKYGSTGLAKKAIDLLEMLANVRKLANTKLGEVIKPVQDILDQLARRLDIEADMAHRARLNAVNPHSFNRISEAAEEAAFLKNQPKWVDKASSLTNRPMDEAVPPPSSKWTGTQPDLARGRHPLDDAHRTFSDIDAIVLPPGTKIYRVVDPTSSDNSICWMSEAEFLKLKSKDDWRRNFAVWASWNSNGEYVTYVVPPGQPLHVWEGVTASQRMGTSDFYLEGGARQIVVDPAHLQKNLVSERRSTNWGYDDLGNINSLVGVPVLMNNWWQKK